MGTIVKSISIFCIVLGLVAVISGIKQSSVRRMCIGGLTIAMSSMSYYRARSNEKGE